MPLGLLLRKRVTRCLSLELRLGWHSPHCRDSGSPQLVRQEKVPLFQVVDHHQAGDISTSLATWFLHRSKSEEGKEVVTGAQSAGHSTAKDPRGLKAHPSQELQSLCLFLQVYLPHTSLLASLLTSPSLQDTVSPLQGFHQLLPLYGNLGCGRQECRLLTQTPCLQHQPGFCPGKNSIESNDD